MPLLLIKLIVSFMARLFSGSFVYKDQIPRLLIGKDYDIENSRRDLDFNPMIFSQGIKKILDIKN